MYFDPCYTICTQDPRAVFDASQATRGKLKKRWISPDKRYSGRNMRATPFAGKQKRRGDRKVWWFIVLARGKVHFEVMGSAWRQDGAGQALFVERLEALLRKMLGPGVKIPRVACTDRGPGFFTQKGYFVREYKDALSHHGFRAYVGDRDGTAQPGDLQECWPHERIAAWAKYWLGKNPISTAGNLGDMEEQVTQRLAVCAKHINENYNVESVSRSWPRTMQKLKKAKGERLPQ